MKRVFAIRVRTLWVVGILTFMLLSTLSSSEENEKVHKPMDRLIPLELSLGMEVCNYSFYYPYFFFGYQSYLVPKGINIGVVFQLNDETSIRTTLGFAKGGWTHSDVSLGSPGEDKKQVSLTHYPVELNLLHSIQAGKQGKIYFGFGISYYHCQFRCRSYAAEEDEWTELPQREGRMLGFPAILGIKKKFLEGGVLLGRLTCYFWV